MSPQAWLALLLFMLLLAAVSLYGLAASGQFPREHRAAEFRARVGAAILFGSIAITVLALFEGLLFASQTIPWYAAVIGGGAPVLFAPLLLRPLPDRFVNGRAALLTFSAAAAVIALVMLELS
ncbi:MAG TPA: hypothetical protein VKT73_03165 [Xanthobacteraceae bacterium]|nr:hypothetical protein [Xanthobacteraceae bacterium]